MFTSESTLAEFYSQTIQPFWQQQVTLGKFTANKGQDAVKAKIKGQLDIAYAYVIHPKAKGSIVISSGRIETLLKYKELVYEFYQQGYSVFIHDHRGQGLSARSTTNLQMGFIHSFDDYVDDFKRFIEQIVKPQIAASHCTQKPYLLCHSMGGAIGALLVLDSPKLFQKAVFSAPMFGIRPALPNWLASMLLTTHGWIGKLQGREYDYFYGQSDYVPSPFLENELTHSAIRYQLFRQEYEDTPEVKLGGVTSHWLRAAMDAMNKIEQSKASPIPALVLQAGADTVVDNVRQARVVANLKNTRLVIIANARHELLMEQDCYRNHCLEIIMQFLQEP